MITYNTDGVKMPSIKKRENTAWVKAVAASYGKRVGEIAYIFVDDEKIHAVMQANAARKSKGKKSKFQQRYEELMRQQEAQQRAKRK